MAEESTLETEASFHRSAQLLRHRHLNEIISFGKSMDIFLYNPNTGIFQNGASPAYLMREVQERFTNGSDPKKCTKSFLNEMLGVVQRLSLTTEKPEEVFDQEPTLLVVQNGAFNLLTGDFEEHSPTHHATRRFPIIYDPEAQCPRWLRFLSQVVASEADIALLQEWFGYNLWPKIETQCFLVVLGPIQTGKSTTLRILIALLGVENCSSIPIQQFDPETDRFALSQIIGKLANIDNDQSDSPLKSAAFLKKILAGELIFVQKKGKDGTHEKPIAKLSFSSNSPPIIPDEQIFAKMLTVSFPHQFLPGNPNRNTNIENELLNELSGIFNWAIEGLRRLHDNNWVFSETKTADQKQNFYKRMADPAQAFLDERTERKEGHVSRDSLYQTYVRFCEREHVRIVSKKKFYAKVRENYDESKHWMEVQGSTENREERCFEGIGPKAVGSWLTL